MPDRETTACLYADPSVPVAEGAGALDWVDADQRRRRWAEELEPRTFGPATGVAHLSTNVATCARSVS